MALSEPGKTRQRKPGPLSSNQTSKRTSSVSSIHSNNSSSSLQASAKALTLKHHGSNKAADNVRIYPTLGSSSSQTSVGKGHERSKSDVAGIKLSAESSSVTSLTSLKKGHTSNGECQEIGKYHKVLLIIKGDKTHSKKVTLKYFIFSCNVIFFVATQT